MDDIQTHYSTLYQLGSNTGASFQTMRELLSAALPPTQLYYLLRLTSFVNEPFRSKAQKLLAHKKQTPGTGDFDALSTTSPTRSRLESTPRSMASEMGGITSKSLLWLRPAVLRWVTAFTTIANGNRGGHLILPFLAAAST